MPTVTTTKAQLFDLRDSLVRLTPPLQLVLFAVKNNGNVDRVYLLDRGLLCELSDVLTPSQLRAHFSRATCVQVAKLAP